VLCAHPCVIFWKASITARPAAESGGSACRFGCQGRRERLANGIRRDAETGQLTYHDGGGKVRLVTQESTRRGLSQGLDEPEFPVRVRAFIPTLTHPTESLWLSQPEYEAEYQAATKRALH